MPEEQKPKIKLSKFAPKTRGHKLLVAIVIIFIAFGGYILIDNSGMNPDRKINDQLAKLNSPEVTCDKVIKEIGNAKADNYNVSTQKELLQKQMMCFADELKFDQSIAAAEKLKRIYDKESDFKNSQWAEERIKDMQAMQQSEAARNEANDSNVQ